MYDTNVLASREAEGERPVMRARRTPRRLLAALGIAVLLGGCGGDASYYTAGYGDDYGGYHYCPE